MTHCPTCGQEMPEPGSRRTQAKDILMFLNTTLGKNYRLVAANLDMIEARLKEGYSVADLRQVIVRQNRQWRHDDKMAAYLRPKTLFNRTNFANYAGELVVKE